MVDWFWAQQEGRGRVVRREPRLGGGPRWLDILLGLHLSLLTIAILVSLSAILRSRLSDDRGNGFAKRWKIEAEGGVVLVVWQRQQV
jgi:hypothetical protein